MNESVTEISEWCNDHPNELAILYISAWDGEENCDASVSSLLENMGIYTIKNCGDLSQLTYQQALGMAKLQGGGSLLAVFNCMTEQYDETINCYGRKDGVDFACYESRGENTTALAWDPFEAYMTSATATDLALLSPNMWMTQAHWQSTALSITMGTLHRSSLLLDEERSKMNMWVADQVAARSFPYLNVLELDHVCDHGLDVYAAIQTVYFQHP
jgi:hypothetical protein